MASDIPLTYLFRKIRKCIENATPWPWMLEVNKNDEPCIYCPDDAYVALLPHQCLASLKEQADKNATFLLSARKNMISLMELAEAGLAMYEADSLGPIPLMEAKKKWEDVVTNATSRMESE